MSSQNIGLQGQVIFLCHKILMEILNRLVMTLVQKCRALPLWQLTLLKHNTVFSPTASLRVTDGLIEANSQGHMGSKTNLD